MPCPSVDWLVRLERAASVPSAGADEVGRAGVCDPGDVTEPPVPEQPAAAGSETAWVAPSWEQVVRDHSARVYRLAYRLSGNAQDAEDLTQET
ncbi:MAG: rpoE, partial [Frankiales bacterium]|nr:rpoE [Frankiales bacterium]